MQLDSVNRHRPPTPPTVRTAIPKHYVVLATRGSAITIPPDRSFAKERPPRDKFALSSFRFARSSSYSELERAGNGTEADRRIVYLPPLSVSLVRAVSGSGPMHTHAPYSRIFLLSRSLSGDLRSLVLVYFWGQMGKRERPERTLPFPLTRDTRPIDSLAGFATNEDAATTTTRHESTWIEILALFSGDHEECFSIIPISAHV